MQRRQLPLASILLALAACGGSGSSPTLTLSGTVSGLTSSGLALANNGVNLDVAAGATSFTFGLALADGIAYAVTAPIQPSGQTCTVANGNGTATTANISNVVVTCSNRTFNVGGTITGLTASGLVLANGSDTLDVSAGTSSFTMPAAVAYGSSYAVTVATQPAGLTCTVSSGTGTISANAVTDIAVSCAGPPTGVAGRITGLGSAMGLVLNSGAATYAVPAGATSFALEAPMAGTYAVRVKSQPAGLTCSPDHDVVALAPPDPASVSITCSSLAYGLGGAIDGLSADGLRLGDGTDTYSVPAGATRFSLPTAVAYGSRYAVSVVAQPPGLTCTVSDGMGTMPDSEVSSVDVTCASSSYTLGGSISGLTASGLVLTDGTDELSVSANAAQFSMPSGLAYGSPYAVTIRTQPSGAQVCEVSNGTGAMDGDVGSVRIACRAATAAE